MQRSLSGIIGAAIYPGLRLRSVSPILRCPDLNEGGGVFMREVAGNVAMPRNAGAPGKSGRSG